MSIAPELAYFVKVNLAFILLYGFYRLFFYKDTYFTLRRIVLLLFYVLAFAYPLFNIQDWVKEQQQPLAEVIYYYYAGSTAEVVVSPASPSGAMIWQNILGRSALFIYLFVGGGLFIQFLIQLFSILQIKSKCRKSEIKGVAVYLLPAPAAPFSFFRAIFIYPENHSEKELEEILTHESTHATQWHSIDVIISKLATIVCWMNPFIWLLKREVRHNLEYLADNTVIHAGYDSKSYQFHLLGLTHHRSTATLYNNFNVLDLKNRIVMMNKKRSRKIGRAKYFVFLPMAVLLLQFCNIDPEKKETLQTTTENNALDLQEQSLKHEEQVFTRVEEMPQFPGGEKELIEFLKENVKYPAEAQQKGIEGRVIASFVVNADGSTSDYEILRGIDEALDKEALRVVASFPKWIPGQQRGQAVRVKYTVPITFRLQAEELTDTPNSSDDKQGDVFTVVETMPSFPGGETKLLEFINKGIKYPVDAQEAGKQGRVIASFIVKKDGSIENIEINRGVYPSLDEEAKRVLSTMPKWIPGEQDGKPVNVKYTVPITFRLQ